MERFGKGSESLPTGSTCTGPLSHPSMKVYCCQHEIDWEQRRPNHERVREILLRTNPEPGALVLLPEMFAAGFSMNVATIAEGGVRESETFLGEIALELGVYLMGGVVTEGAGGRGRNEAVVFNPTGIQCARYRKIRPFTPGGESLHYEAGGGPVVFEWEGCKVAPFICYDLRFPEIQRAVARHRVGLMTFIASWPEARWRHWVHLLQARAIENQCYVAGVNRIGSDPHLRYTGHSVIVDFEGNILADAGSDQVVISAPLDLDAMEAYRRRLPFLDDIRFEFLGGS